MNDFAWKSFCDKMDEALKPVTMAKKIMAFGIGGTITVALTFIIVGFVTFATLASKSVSSFGDSTSPALGMIPFGVGMVLMIVGSVGSSCYASSKSSEAMNAMKKVCEETSAMHQGISFHIRDEMRFLGHRGYGGGYNNGYGNNGYGGGYNSNVNISTTNFIEVYVNDGTTSTAQAVQGYFAPTSAPSAPVMAIAEADIRFKSPEVRMRELDNMKTLLTEDEYQAKRAEILSDV